MQSIASFVASLFRQHSRADVTDALTATLLESVVSAEATPERLVADHCLLVAILHVNVGAEIGTRTSTSAQR